MGAASRPYDLPRVAPGNVITATKKINVNEPTASVLNITKKNRQSNTGNNALPGFNDVLSGLLNVVGEGLSFATNYVKEENERKKEAAASKLAKEKEASRLAALEKMSISAVPALLPGRVNNRGPPRFTEIPFEAIPLGNKFPYYNYLSVYNLLR